ncbi:MAG: GT4 family glycosyltransferase PelF [Lachnospiraceae bacterium]|nr:GT4 family glycosyltransferase PelF [Lachnospiraceae bacterium]
MKIAMFVEGCYPYVVGGVSSWVQMLLEARRETDFIIHSLLPDRQQSGQFKYTMPENVLEIREAYLNDHDVVKPFRKKTKLNDEEKSCFRKLIFGENIDWLGIFRFFEKDNISVNDILMGEEFFEIVQDLYIEKYPQCVFTDFLWSVRSLYLPLFTILKVPVAEADCYHAISTGYAGILACKGHYLYQKPILLTEHGIYTREREEEIIKVDWTQGIYKDLWIRYFYTLSSCIYDCASQVISLFQQARKIQLELGCPKEKARVISNGVYVKQFENIQGKDPEDTFINVGAVLRVVPIKDVKTMINAFALAKMKVPNLKLYIMGPTDENPEYYEECLEFIRGFQVADIEFTGRVNVKEYLGKMDMTILTSISEGQPLSILESMAASKPCIATDVGGCKELLYGGEKDSLGRSGIIVPVMNVDKIANAMVTLAKDEVLREDMGYSGRLRVKAFYRNEQVTRTYGELYEQYKDGK